MSEEKDKIIDKIYNSEEGFGSIAKTYKEARLIDKTISLDNVKNWFKKNIEQKKKPHGQNSFVAHHAYQEFQLDLFFIMDMPNQTYKVGVMLVDVFSREMHVVPLNSKKEKDLLEGLKKCMAKFDKKPSVIYSDDEGALNTQSIQQYFKDNDLLHTSHNTWTRRLR